MSILSEAAYDINQVQ